MDDPGDRAEEKPQAPGRWCGGVRREDGGGAGDATVLPGDGAAEPGGSPLLATLPDPAIISPEEFEESAEEGLVLDTRTELAFGAAHVPGALSIWLAGVPSFAGWFLPYDKDILLVDETGDLSVAIRQLRRIGYDRLAGHLAGGMVAWHMAGKRSDSIATATVPHLCARLDREEKENAWILDVRGDDELKKSGRITGAHQIHITELPERIGELPRDRPIYIFCGSGLRSMVAASILRREGMEEMTVILGGLPPGLRQSVRW